MEKKNTYFLSLSAQKRCEIFEKSSNFLQELQKMEEKKKNTKKQKVSKEKILEISGLGEKEKFQEYFAEISSNLGYAYERMRKFKEAQKCYDISLEISKKIFGPEHLATAESKLKFDFRFSVKKLH